MSKNKMQPHSGNQVLNVFISYARDDYFIDENIIIDNNIVLQLTKALDESKISYWLDLKKINPGDDWAGKIVTNIEKACVFLVILTDNANKSENVSKEVKIAIEERKKIIPVIVDDTKAEGAIKYHISNLDYFKCKYSQHINFSSLIETIRLELQKVEQQKKNMHQIHAIENEITDVNTSINNIKVAISEKKSEIERLTDDFNEESIKLVQLKKQLADLTSEESHDPRENGNKPEDNKYNLLSTLTKNKWLPVIAVVAFVAAIFLWISIAKNKSLEENLAEIIEDYSSEITSLKPLYLEYKKGDSKASMLLGATILDSINGTKAKKTGRWLVQKAANDNLAEAQNLIGTFYYQGINDFQLDYDSASYWFNKGIENNSLDALRNMGEAYADGKYVGKNTTEPRRTDAIALLRQASQRGDGKSMVRLGRLYYNTRDSIKKYPQKAKKMKVENDSSKYWMQRALENNDLQPSLRSDAQYFIGMYYYCEYIAQKNDMSGAMALKWFKESSENEEAHPYSFYYIGKLYESLEGNKEMAISYYKMAAHHKVEEANRRLYELSLQ